jgi:hypothetical protein
MQAPSLPFSSRALSFLALSFLALSFLALSFLAIRDEGLSHPSVAS